MKLHSPAVNSQRLGGGKGIPLYKHVCYGTSVGDQLTSPSIHPTLA